MKGMTLRLVAAGCATVASLQTSGAATHVWTGGGTTALWSDAANWQGNNSPQSGESAAVLVFPPGSSRLRSTNDLAGLALAQLALSGANYVLNGTNALMLSPSPEDSIVASGSSNQVTLPLILQATNSFSVATNASLLLAGHLSGPGAFTLNSGGLLALAPLGGVDNTYQGTTRVLAGTLQLQSGYTNTPIFGNTIYAIAVPGDIVVGETNSLAPAFLTGLATSTNTGLTLLGSGRYLGGGTIGSLAGDGSIDAQGLDLTVGGNNCSTAFSGQIFSSSASAGALLEKAGTGTQILTSGSVGSVELDVIGGTLIVDGDFSNSPCIISGGTLEGNGSLDNVLAYGSISPGHATSGQLTCASCDLSIHCRFIAQLAGTRAGIDYNQLVVTQYLSFETTDPLLDVQMAPGFVGALGNEYTIIRNDGTNPVTLPPQPPGNIGFNGLAEGVSFTLPNGAAFRISYQGGDGNDVVLTQMSLPVQPTLGGVSRLGDGEMQITGMGLPNTTYSVWANTNLATTNWLDIGTATADTGGLLQFTDPAATNFSTRFYRFSWP